MLPGQNRGPVGVVIVALQVGELELDLSAGARLTAVGG